MGRFKIKFVASNVDGEWKQAEVMRLDQRFQSPSNVRKIYCNFEDSWTTCSVIKVNSLEVYAGSRIFNGLRGTTVDGSLPTVSLNEAEEQSVVDPSVPNGWMIEGPLYLSTLHSAFNDRTQIDTIDMSEVNTSNVVSISWMFAYCKQLKYIDLSNFDTSNVWSNNSMFTSTPNLEKVRVTNCSDATIAGLLSELNYDNPQDVGWHQKGEYLVHSWTLKGTTIDGSLPTVKINDIVRTVVPDPAAPNGWMVTNLPQVTISSEEFIKDQSKVNSVQLAKLATTNSGSTRYMFAGCVNLTSLDLSKNDFTYTTDMHGMFEDCTGLTALDLSNFNAFSVYDLSDMFNRCTSLESINISGIHSTGITDMSLMFGHCSALRNLDLSTFTTENVRNMSSMFLDCTSLETLDLSNFSFTYDVWHQIANIDSMFAGCTSLSRVHVKNCSDDTINKLLERLETDCAGGFDSWHQDGEYLVPVVSPAIHGTTTDGSLPPVMINDIAFDSERSRVSDNAWRVEIEEAVAYSLNGFLKGRSLVDSVDLSALDLSEVTTMREMFYWCFELKDVNIYGPTSSNLVNTYFMFQECTSLESIDLSNLNMSNVTNAESMFGECTSLKSIDFGDFDASELTSSGFMFSQCDSLEFVNTASWTLDKVYTAYNMFDGCDSLQSIDLSNCTLRRLRYANSFIANCPKLKTVDLSSAHPEALEFASDWFANCTSLQSVDLSNWQFAYGGMSGMFAYCPALERVKVTNCDEDTIRGLLDHLEQESAGGVNNWAHIGEYLVPEVNYLRGTTFDGSLPKALVNNTTYRTSKDDDVEKGWEVSIPVAVESLYKVMCDQANVNSIDFSEVNTSKATNFALGFYGLWRIQSIDLSTADTSKVETFERMFEGCRALESIDFGGLNTSSAKNMKQMFKGCENLKRVDLSICVLSRLETMESLFNGCTRLTEVDFSGSNFGSSVNCAGMFSGCDLLTKVRVTGCSRETIDHLLTNLNNDHAHHQTTWHQDGDYLTYRLSNAIRAVIIYPGYTPTIVINNGSVEMERDPDVDEGWQYVLPDYLVSLRGMFSGEQQLRSVDCSALRNYYSIPILARMFFDCPRITSIDLSMLDTSSAVDMSFMFTACTNLETLDLSNFNFGSNPDLTNMFYNCPKLRSIKIENVSYETYEKLMNRIAEDRPGGTAIWVRDGDYLIPG